MRTLLHYYDEYSKRIYDLSPNINISVIIINSFYEIVQYDVEHQC